MTTIHDEDEERDENSEKNHVEKKVKPEKRAESSAEGEFQVPVRRVKSINRPKIVENQSMSNRYVKLQEVGEKLQEIDTSNGVTCTNSDASECTDKGSYLIIFNAPKLKSASNS